MVKTRRPLKQRTTLEGRSYGTAGRARLPLSPKGKPILRVDRRGACCSSSANRVMEFRGSPCER
jgi:hypothetical protein